MKKYAFTLAEVLITLGIIGVVASMTLPTVVNKYKEKETVTKLKKFYSILSQSYLSATQQYGSPSEWGITGRDAGSSDEDEESYNAVAAILIRDRLFKNIKKLKTCDNAKNRSLCGLASDYYFLNNTKESETSSSTAKTASLLLADGSSVLVIANNGSGSGFNRGPGVLSGTYANIYIDINGSKAPNTFGRDFFVFYLTNKNIMPAGTEHETKWPFSGCSTNGVGCAAWVIMNENMDYLKCKDLSWKGKQECK